LFLAAVVLLFAPAWVYGYVVKRKAPAKAGAVIDEKGFDGLGAETARITSRDGLRLHAYYLPREGAGGYALLAHGYTADARFLLPEAELFRERLRFNVLLPDARGHGLSEGSYSGFGWHERLDCLDWIQWLLARAERDAPGRDPRVVLYGVSMGAATVMMASGEEDLPPQVAAVIEDCGYTSLEEELAWQMKKRWHVQSRRLLMAAGDYTKKKAGFSFAEVSAINRLRKSKTPTLFIHGDADDFVPFGMVHSLYGACRAPKELYVVKGAAHAASRAAFPEAYEEHLRAFIEKYVFNKTESAVNALDHKEPS
ncbi:MAG: alpha/beta hydrolase, partial [Treponema sp.]|nr:alpha/beta hydrolase [Treponema sp.]